MLRYVHINVYRNIVASYILIKLCTRIHRIDIGMNKDREGIEQKSVY